VAAKPAYPGPGDALREYEALIATDPAVERKGAKMPYTSANGHMVTFLDETGVACIRLPGGLREEFLARYGATLAEQHGRVMADFVAVPPSLLASTAELRPWFEAANAHAANLKPKATDSAEVSPPCVRLRNGRPASAVRPPEHSTNRPQERK
jgi:hypothetical protein